VPRSWGSRQFGQATYTTPIKEHAPGGEALVKQTWEAGSGAATLDYKFEKRTSNRIVEKMRVEPARFRGKGSGLIDLRQPWDPPKWIELDL
jgi:hypothetical protein